MGKRPTLVEEGDDDGYGALVLAVVLRAAEGQPLLRLDGGQSLDVAQGQYLVAAWGSRLGGASSGRERGDGLPTTVFEALAEARAFEVSALAQQVGEGMGLQVDGVVRSSLSHLGYPSEREVLNE